MTQKYGMEFDIMARPEGSDLTHSLRIRMTSSDKIRLKESANDAGLTVSEHVRRCCSLSSPMSKPSEQADQQQAALIYELNKIGVNLNQLTKNVHYGHTDVIAVRSAIDNLQIALEKILK